VCWSGRRRGRRCCCRQTVSTRRRTCSPGSAATATATAGDGWGYRLRLKGNLLANTGHGDETTTGGLAHGVAERYLPGVRLFARGVMTNLGILHEAGHPEPWIIAMDCPPHAGGGAGLLRAVGHRADVLRFQGPWLRLGGFATGTCRPPGTAAPRHVVGDALVRPRRPGGRAAPPDAARKKTQAQSDPGHWSFRKLHRSAVSWFTRGLRRLKRCLQNGIPLPTFHVVMRN